MSTDDQKTKVDALISRFKNNETTPEEDLQIAELLNGSLDLLKFFLNEVKVEKKRQEIINSN